ncbi:carbohydrate ABC transporter permease [Paenibacillus mucilaginosus]|uniref:Protein LplC n=3 Tax=Paenibacillus mucilaginosus TaxID=61624 RepID=H6NAB1_9BACL|nr:carbohydrate ABC transporter permease [Paenibacillus mucilaginosus]AEI40751.1 protein LplC [Paenibacillus mucilaginosus KNP414]AFC29357.1 protein LplC [Paenibacillus mucilaginosus 3016]AFH61537.1 sugar ABC transporter permease [Paenibacillus mucilaginosus K02]MCG7211769.1 carbohydrate ABC transporter permease [Paenibacillus mucilaginosus]WDM29879.1 carbohydrate ABC transporter permease [Paenibacillus mucilaginosus]
MMTTTVKKNRADQRILDLIGYVFVGLVALVCLVPFLLVVSGSFSSESSITREGFGLWPKEFSLAAYQFAFQHPEQFINAYVLTISLTVVGTVLGLFISAMTAYVLQRQDFQWKSGFAFYFYFTTLFQGGLVPWYILMVNYLQMKDTYWALLLPPMLNVFYILILRTFLRSIPEAITESAKIDGAGDFTIFVKLILPLSKPALATIGLFTALGYWNDWFNSLLFVSNEKLYTLQYLLYKTLGNLEGLRKLMEVSGMRVAELPGESLKMALAIIVTGPIVLLYPFVQRFFVQGLTVGAVKG